MDKYSGNNSDASGIHTFTMQQELFNREVLDSSVIHSVKKKGVVGNVGLEISMLPSANTAITEAFSERLPPEKTAVWRAHSKTPTSTRPGTEPREKSEKKKSIGER